jgi:hypothetical protein
VAAGGVDMDRSTLPTIGHTMVATVTPTMAIGTVDMEDATDKPVAAGERTATLRRTKKQNQLAPGIPGLSQEKFCLQSSPQEHWAVFGCPQA